MRAAIEASIKGVTGWVEAHNFKAYDPGDGNLSPLHHWLGQNLYLERLLTASVLRSPFPIRPLLGIKPHTSTKGMGYMAWGYLRMYVHKRENSYRDRAVKCLNWLIENSAPGWVPFCWGNHFTFVTRQGRNPAFEPNIVWSSLIGLAFLEAYEVIGDRKYLEIASSVCDFILGLPREKTLSGNCLSYVPFRQRSIHNANMLGAGLLASVSKYTDDMEALLVAREAILYSCSRQRPDGAWAYGEAAKNGWVDNFHTGYNLDSLKRYILASGDKNFNGQLGLGLTYFKNHFFERSGRPRYYDIKTFPIDIQCAAQAIDTLSFFADSDQEALELAVRVATWTLLNLQDPDGHFYYRDLGWTKIKTPMFHWGQATMFKALAHLLTKLSDKITEDEMAGLFKLYYDAQGRR